MHVCSSIVQDYQDIVQDYHYSKTLYCAEFSIEDTYLVDTLRLLLLCTQCFFKPGCCLSPQRCDVCREVGATVGCCASWCTANYHFQCAHKAKCLFLQNKEVYCEQHTSLSEGKVLLLMFLPFLLYPFLRDCRFTET